MEKQQQPQQKTQKKKEKERKEPVQKLENIKGIIVYILFSRKVKIFMSTNFIEMKISKKKFRRI